MKSLKSIKQEQQVPKYLWL